MNEPRSLSLSVGDRLVNCSKRVSTWGMFLGSRLAPFTIAATLGSAAIVFGLIGVWRWLLF